MGFENSLASSYEIHFKSSEPRENRGRKRVNPIVVQFDKTLDQLNVALPLNLSNINIINNSIQSFDKQVIQESVI